MIEKRKAILQEALKCKNLKKLDKRDFLKVWKSLAFLQPGLHPDDASDWPRILKQLAREAFRRAKISELSDDELYCYREVLKGIKARCKSK